jgi:hypothetical protein
MPAGIHRLRNLKDESPVGNQEDQMENNHVELIELTDAELHEVAGGGGDGSLIDVDVDINVDLK